MRKILNPYNQIEGYNCFGCGANNEYGLKMELFEDGDDIVCTWNPKSQYQGYFDVLHGGIQSTMIDEIASWVVFVKLKTGGVTSKLEVKYRQPVYTNKGTITLRARLLEQKRKVAIIGVELFDSENKLCAEGTAHYFIFPQEIALKKLKYPGYDQFFEE